jgi:hypothetical protein
MKTKWSQRAAAVVAVLSVACTPEGPKAPVRDQAAEQFFRRASVDFDQARIDEAQDAIGRALAIAPNDAELQKLGGRIALARLEFDESLRLLHNVPGSEAHGLRGRAHWFRGELGSAAQELEAMLNDPSVVDDWARAVAPLARAGEGRTPYALGGDPRAVLDMAHVSLSAPYLVVPVEVDGEDALALIATNVEDVQIDAATHPQASWISLRFKSAPSPGMTTSAVEMVDVPALPKDLAGVSREGNTNIKALIGVNVLRQLNVTIDFNARQFVVRRQPAPPPPESTRVRVLYSRGGSMLLSAGLGAAEGASGTFFVDSTSRFPLAVDDGGLEKTGIPAKDLGVFQGESTSKLKQGTLEVFKLGAFDLKKVPAIYGTPVSDVEKAVGFDVDGVIGVPLLAFYRFTFADNGRVLYLEDDSEVRRMAEEYERMPLVGPENTTDPGAGPVPPVVPPMVPPVVAPGPGGVP